MSRAKVGAKGKSKAKVKKASAKKSHGHGRFEDDDVDMDHSSSSLDFDSDSDDKRGKAQVEAKKHERDGSGMLAAPDMSAFAVWKQGDSDIKASAKTLKMIEYLKEWESTGDKTIVFSQCKRTLFSSLPRCLRILMQLRHRDFHARPV